MDWATLKAQVEVEVKEGPKEALHQLVADFVVFAVEAAIRLQDPPPKADELLTIDQLATKLQVKPGMIYQRIRRGQLVATRFGKFLRVREKDAIRPNRPTARVKKLI